MPYPTAVIRIFNFDGTLTDIDSFQSFSIEKCLMNILNQTGTVTKPRFIDYCFQQGKLFAKEHTNNGVKHTFVCDRKRMSLVISCHDNPYFIAGFVSGLLNLDLTIEQHHLNTAYGILSCNSSRSKIIISSLATKNIDKLINDLTSASQTAYDKSKKTLPLELINSIENYGKNIQLTELYQFLQSEMLIDNKTKLYFCDADQRHAELAKSLTFLNKIFYIPFSTPIPNFIFESEDSFLINRIENLKFTLLDVDRKITGSDAPKINNLIKIDACNESQLDLTK